MATAERAIDEPLMYAVRLARALWEKYWEAHSPYWEPLPDLLGVLTQIDNMTAGLVRADAASPASGGEWKEIERLRAALKKVRTMIFNEPLGVLNSMRSNPVLEIDATLAASSSPSPSVTEEERIALWMIANSYATGHGDTIEDMLAELESQIKERATLTEHDIGTLQAAVENLRGGSRDPERRVEAAFRIAYELEQITKRPTSPASGGDIARVRTALLNEAQIAIAICTVPIDTHTARKPTLYNKEAHAIARAVLALVRGERGE